MRTKNWTEQIGHRLLNTQQQLFPNMFNKKIYADVLKNCFYIKGWMAELSKLTCK